MGGGDLQEQDDSHIAVVSKTHANMSDSSWKLPPSISLHDMWMTGQVKESPLGS